MGIIPFYGAQSPEMFAIERAAMDRPGRVIEALDRQLGVGRILDVGAGDGFTAERLTSSQRSVVALEPATGMIRSDRDLSWVQGEAERLPFADHCFDGAYSTWAYFFPNFHDIEPGLDELRRVVRPGGPIIIVDNAGGDDFCAMAARDIIAPLDWWRGAGFTIEIVETAFEFDSLVEATALLEFFFDTQAEPALEVSFNAATMTTVA